MVAAVLLVAISSGEGVFGNYETAWGKDAIIMFLTHCPYAIRSCLTCLT
jgi:hypothetical protein